MYSFFVFLSCSKPSLEELWEQSPEGLIENSEQLSSFEQQRLFRLVRDEQGQLMSTFCSFSHTSEVEYACSLLERRPHLTDLSQSSSRSILHGYSPEQGDYSLQERFSLVQQKKTTQEIASICNGIKDDVMRSECYFVAADAHNNRRGTKAFQDMMNLCFASGPFVRYCLSHIQQRVTIPVFTDVALWKEWDDRFTWMRTHPQSNVRQFGEELIATIAFRVVGEMTPLCWDKIHEDTHIEKILKDNLVFFIFLQQGEKRDFQSALENWDEIFLPSCTTEITRNPPRAHSFNRPVRYQGETTAFVKGGVRPTVPQDQNLDRAFTLVESAYLISDRFVLIDAQKHSHPSIQERAKKLLHLLNQ